MPARRASAFSKKARSEVTGGGYTPSPMGNRARPRAEDMPSRRRARIEEPDGRPVAPARLNPETLELDLLAVEDELRPNDDDRHGDEPANQGQGRRRLALCRGQRPDPDRGR